MKLGGKWNKKYEGVSQLSKSDGNIALPTDMKYNMQGCFTLPQKQVLAETSQPVFHSSFI